MKLDMHVHSKYSKDSLLKIRTMRKVCNKLEITPIITDHNEIRGNLHYQCPILASEISTRDGHVIGYFINEKIKQNLSAIETIEEIHSQGGLACLPHPFDRIRRTAVKAPEAFKKADIIEVFNSRIMFREDNRKALNYAIKNKKLMTVGSDGHFSREIGKSYIDIAPFDSPNEFMKNLKKAKYVTKAGSPVFEIATAVFKRTIGRII